MYVYQTCGSSLVFHFILMNQERTRPNRPSLWVNEPFFLIQASLLHSCSWNCCALYQRLFKIIFHLATLPTNHQVLHSQHSSFKSEACI